MEIEKIALYLIYAHAFFGGIALLAGLIAIIAKKGGSAHKKLGKLFFFTMLLSAFTALVISVLPNHHSPFLFVVGIFSSYFILTGYRALRLKNKNPDLKLDILISWAMLVTGIIMILYPLVLTHSINIVLTVFGVIGIILSARDLSLFKRPETLQNKWLRLHLGKMVGGYISATTAFVVVNDFFPSIYGWFLPGIIGGFYITYWMRKFKPKTAHGPLS